MAHTIESFTHDPLDLASSTTIRLIEVLPPQPGSESIQCKLTHKTTDVQYTCLSYVWGLESSSHDVYINGRVTWVRPNLWRFLRAVSMSLSRAHPTQQSSEKDSWLPQALWIDALCIDQENIDERNHQVQQMGEIYKNAHSVIAWLHDTEDADECSTNLTSDTWDSELTGTMGIDRFCSKAY